MHKPLLNQHVIQVLLVATILLPITICVVLGVAALLMSMGDISGGGGLQRVALGCGILWVIDLISLILVLALHATREKDHHGPDDSEDACEP